MLRINHNLINKTMESKDQMFYNTTKDVIEKIKTGKVGKWQGWKKGDFVPRPDIDEFIAKYCNSEGITIMHKNNSPKGGNIPYFNGNDEEVFIPSLKPATEIYYAAVLHELSHSTGMPQRLKRSTFFAPLVIFMEGLEEIVAELSSMYLCHKFGIDSFDNSVSYIKDWCENENIDPKAVNDLMPLAIQSANYILEHAK